MEHPSLQFGFAQRVFSHYEHKLKRAIPTLSPVEMDWMRQLCLGEEHEWIACISEQPSDCISAWQVFIFRIRTALLEHYHTPHEHWPSSTGDDLYLDDVYWTLEEDEDMIEYYRSVQASNDVELDENLMEAADSLDLQEIEVVQGLGSIKNLVQVVEKHSRKSNNPWSLERFKSLILEIRPKPASTSKWANEDRVGQLELYEALEKVLEELKGNKDHAFPFLQKVNKRDAPDYYNIIKNPMDLGTMGKKMKASQYQSKDEFQKDLELIWENCLYYNSDPASVYRVHATEMKKKADDLMSSVPDIRIRTREEAEAEGFDPDVLQDNSATPPEKEEETVTGSGNLYMEEIVKEAAPPTPEVKTVYSLQKTANFGRVVSSCDRPLVSFKAYVDSLLTTEANEEIPLELLSPDQVRYWQFMWESKCEWIIRREQMLDQFSVKDGMGEVFMKTSEDTQAIFTSYDFFIRRRMGDKSPDLPADGFWEDLFYFPEERSLSGAIPEAIDSLVLAEPSKRLDPRPLSLDLSCYSAYFHETMSMFQEGYHESRLEKQPSLAEFQASYPPEKGIAKVKTFVETLRECRRLERKLYDTIQQTISFEPKTTTDDFMDEDPPDEITLNLQQPQNLSRKSIIVDRPEQAFDLLNRSSALLLIESGFDGFTRSASFVFTEVFRDFIVTIGRLLRVYIDQYGKEKTIDEIILQVLYETGIHDVSQLDLHYVSEPKRRIAKLERIKKRLNDYYDMLMHDDDEEAEEDISEDVAFVMGDFGLAMGDDYLGLKSLGIETAIPEKLWNVDNKKSQFIKKRRKEKLVQKWKTLLIQPEIEEISFKAPPAFPPITSTEGIIKLMHSFIQKKLEESGTGYVVEDEFLPKREKTKKKRSPSESVKKGRPKGSTTKKKQNPQQVSAPVPAPNITDQLNSS